MVRVYIRSLILFGKVSKLGVTQKRVFWKSAHWLYRSLPVVLGIYLFFSAAWPIQAQTSASAFLAQPDTANFPQITTYLDVQDDQGFIHGLQASQLSIRENDQQLPVNELIEVHPGVQFIVAIAPGPSFAIRDSLGNSRYSYIGDAMRTWSGIPSQSPPDDFSLIAAGYPEVLHFSASRDWFAAFDGYQPDARSAKPTLDVLTRAVAVAGGETPRPGMGRVVLFITAPQSAETTTNLQDLVTRAKQTGTRVFVWLVAAPDIFGSQGTIQLQNLANQTGGKLLTFSGNETIPNLEDILEPLRSAYALSYDSKIKTSGIHQLAVDINMDSLQVLTQPCSFELMVLPPNPIFISLPASIARAKAEGTPVQKLVTATAHAPNLEPVEQKLEILIEFPDGHPRPLERTALYVDGALVAENTAPPFEVFTWDLRSYLQSGKHLLRVEVMDSLGLNGVSVDSGVHIIIQQPERSFLSLLLSWQNALLAGFVVVAAGILALLLLVLRGRIHPGWALQTTHPNPRKLPSRRGMHPRTAAQESQPAEKASSQHIPGWFSHIQLHQHRPAPKAPAFLVPLSDAEESSPVAPIPITANVITFGSDSLKATLVLEDTSVEALHARLQRENGSFRLADSGSIAGTWVNYTPVSQQGIILENGDFIHIGRIGFRFTQREQARVRKLVVIPKPDEAELKA
jgi:hypothetical protein